MNGNDKISISLYVQNTFIENLHIQESGIKGDDACVQIMQCQSIFFMHGVELHLSNK